MVIAKVWMSKVSIWLIGMCLLVCTAGIVLGTRARTSWEPRGRITYVKNVWTGNEGVYVTDPDGNNVKRLTSLSCTDVAISPVWSPDGNYIAFGCRGAEGNNLCLMDTAGLWPPAPTCFDSASLIDPEKVPSKFCDEYHVHSISWAPDGQRLAFTCPYQQGIASSELVCIIDLTGDVDCWPLSVIDRGGAEIHGMAKVAWSPTDERLAISFDSLGDKTDDKIYLSNPDGQNSTFLVEGRNPRWSPDGEQIVFLREGAIYVIDRNGSAVQSLYKTPSDTHFPADSDEAPVLFDSTATWSPDGYFIAFEGSRTTSDGGYGIYILNLRTKKIERITEPWDGRFSEPDWSPPARSSK